MNCDRVVPLLSLAAYGELDDGDRHLVETHLAECPRCSEEWTELQRLKVLLMPASPMPDGDFLHNDDVEHLLTRLRASLSAALDSEAGLQADSSTAHTRAAPGREMRPRLRWAASLHWMTPVLSVMLVGAGFAAGWLSHRPQERQRVRPVAESAVERPMPSGSAAESQMESQEEPAAFMNPDALLRVNSVERAPNGRVRIHFDTVEEHSMIGRFSDPRVRQMLLYAVQHPPNSGIRLDSLDVLGTETQNRQVRRVLIHVLLHDVNPGVRLKALESLSPQVSSDPAVRQAVVHAVLHDDNSGVRSQAVNVLSQAPRTEAAPLLRRAGDQTGNLYLRLQIAAALRQMQAGVPSRWLDTMVHPAVSSQ